jgi:hypothetical protein
MSFFNSGKQFERDSGFEEAQPSPKHHHSSRSALVRKTLENAYPINL